MVEIKAGNLNDLPRMRQTSGALLSNGIVLELVEPNPGRGLELLRWDGAHYEIAPHFQEDGTIYTACYVHSSALLATRLPRGPAEYGDPTHLLSKIADFFRQHMGFSRDQAVFFAQVVF